MMEFATGRLVTFISFEIDNYRKDVPTIPDLSHELKQTCLVTAIWLSGRQGSTIAITQV